MYLPSFKDAAALSASCNVIPVYAEVYADIETPISILKRFSDSKYCFLLESVEGGEKWARYSFIGRNPFLTIKSYCKDNRIENIVETLCQPQGEVTQRITVNGNPVDVLKQYMESYRSAEIPGLPRFTGGAAGYFGYELIHFYEELPPAKENGTGVPDCNLMLTDEVIVYDHLKQKIYVIVNLRLDCESSVSKLVFERKYLRAVERIKEILREIRTTRWKVDENMPVPANEQQNTGTDNEITFYTSKEEFCSNVEKAKEYIKNGDIFQVVLSQRIRSEYSGSPLDLYRVLRSINPSPYMFYLNFDGYQIIGASPEMLVRVEDGIIETCPIAGTRPRGKTPEEDKIFIEELLSDEKERSEHTMLVDLGRNDIGKVCEYGSIKLTRYMQIEKYSHVMHLVSNITGTLRKDKTIYDGLMSVFPAGTLSGAPKIRAMEIIHELENTGRGPYGGSVAYLGFNGNLDSCITIRTVVLKDKNAYVQAGAGIVADSVPDSEYLETLNKAAAMIKAIKKAGEL